MPKKATLTSRMDRVEKILSAIAENQAKHEDFFTKFENGLNHLLEVVADHETKMNQHNQKFGQIAKLLLIHERRLKEIEGE